MSSHVTIRRYHKVLPVTIGTTQSASTSIRLNDVAGGIVQVPSETQAGVTIGVFGSYSESGPYARLYNAAGEAETITVASSPGNQTMYPLPDSVYAVPFIKLVGSAAITSFVVLKS